MKTRNNVIFLIEPNSLDRDLLSRTIEKVTNCRVFNFFSIEESILYWKLNPALVINHSEYDFKVGQHISDGVDVINITKEMPKENNSKKLKGSNLAMEIGNMANKILV